MSVILEAKAEVIEPASEIQVTYTPAVITNNLEALNAYVEKEIAPYIGAQIDPENNDSIKTARAVMAELNKLKAPIEAERKRVKKEYEAPLKAFEQAVKAITAKIDDARTAIKVQVDEADQRFLDIRRERLKEEYDGCAGAIADVIPFSAILEDQWLNRSTMEGKAVNALYEKTENALKGYKTLQAKELHHKDEVIKKYADTLDLIAALELEDKLNDHDRQMAEFKAAQEAAQMVAKQRTEPEPTPEPEPVSEPTTGPAVIVADTPSNEPTYKWSLSMEFTGSREFAERVGSTLKATGITGASIKCMGVCHE